MLTAWDKEIIKLALEEDIGAGDITTEALEIGAIETKALIIAKQNGILAGIDVACEVFNQIDDSLAIDLKAQDGDTLEPDQAVMQINGKAGGILAGERTALNFMAHLSGIATATRTITEITGNGPPFIRDTRKTTPGLRSLEKTAVAAGGGSNHRMGLYDGILIKDNHLKLLPIREALSRVKKKTYSEDVVVEVEVDNLEQLSEVLEAGADMVLLDNMSPSQVKEAVAMAKDKVLMEVSGGIRPDNIAGYVLPGISYISMGAITQGTLALDFSLEIVGFTQ